MFGRILAEQCCHFFLTNQSGLLIIFKRKNYKALAIQEIYLNKFCEFSKGCSFFLALNKETRDKVIEVLVAVNLKYFWNTYSQKIMNALTCCTFWKTFLDQESRCDVNSYETFHIREFGPKMLLSCTQLCDLCKTNNTKFKNHFILF